jgi:ABC-type glycerol-3-phosphate transport system substrate-binding protein
MRRAAGALALAILLAGCGSSQSTSDRRMNAQFDALDTKIATQYETAATPYNDYLEKATQQYIALVHKYAHQLGPTEAKKRLDEKGDEVGAFCSWCAGALYDAAKKY